MLQSLNYAPVALGIVMVVSLGWWVCGAHTWFTGPRRTVDEITEDPTGMTAVSVGAGSRWKSATDGSDDDDLKAAAAGKDPQSPAALNTDVCNRSNDARIFVEAPNI